MKNGILSLSFLCVLSLSQSAIADELDKHSQEALTKTQKLLENKSKRDAAIKGDAKAEKADAFVNKVSGGNAEINQEIYQIASKVFEKITKEANGDPEKMKAAMAKFTRDPESFSSELTPEQIAKIRELGDKITGSPSHP